jgi:hypothetical protein
MDEPNPSADDPDQRAQPVRVRSVDACGTTFKAYSSTTP